MLKPVFFNLRIVLAPVLLGVMFLTMARLVYFVWQFDRMEASGELAFIFLQGLRFDLVLMSLIYILPLSVAPLFFTHHVLFKPWRVFMLIYTTTWFMFICFMEFSTPSFINQYDSRPNYLFVEYLEHYRELGATLLAEYPLQLLIAAIMVPLLSWLHLRLYRRLMVLERPLHWLVAAMLVPVLFTGFLMGARSTLGHRPVNPAAVAVTNDHLVNELALSSAYTLMYAIYQARYDEKGGKPYGKMPFEKVVKIIRDEMNINSEQFISETMPTWHRPQDVHLPEKPRNLVIILEESLGAEFVGKLGGLPLTPNLDRMADQGIWFENLYATGTRSVRGIEAVITGFLPTAAISVVKQNKAQRNFFTLAGYLKQYGYETGFIYGGESHFDNMRGFFMGNGFDYVIDEKDYDNPVFRGSWGVSDEDLFDMADRKFSSYGEDQPFFSLVFTSSFHSPFEFPDGRIERGDDAEHDAVKYADYAVGRFIQKAKQSAYWDNTIFLIIADHNSRAYGDALVPIDHFHIPGLILGGPIKPDFIETQASQVDIGPTLLSMMGFTGEYPMTGRDLTRPEIRQLPGRSIMQFYKTLAYREGDDVVVLRYDLPPAKFHYHDNRLIPASDIDQSLVDKALAHSIFPQKAYDEKLYPQSRQPGSNIQPLN